jgi:hypothetical protein
MFCAVHGTGGSRRALFVPVAGSWVVFDDHATSVETFAVQTGYYENAGGFSGPAAPFRSAAYYNGVTRGRVARL